MKKKWILVLGIGISLGLILTAWAVSVGWKTAPQANKRRKSSLYRGLPVKTVYGESHLQEKSGKYVFDAVLQGDLVKHDFLFRNPTGEPLQFKKVKSCCGTIVENYSRTRIDPGKEGSIMVFMLTDRYGGQSIEGDVYALTTSKTLPEIHIHISQPVKEFARIDPHKIILRGTVHDKLVGTSVIEPGKDYPFRITGIKSKKNQDILFDFKEITAGGRKKYRVTVQNRRKRKGIYRNILFIRTDRKERPEFKIRVEGYITE